MAVKNPTTTKITRALIVSGSALLVGVPSFSQGSAGTQQNKPAAWGARKDEYKSEKLEGIVPLPGVPQYTGKAVFVSGLRYPSDPTGSRIGMTLGVNENDDEVIEWYKNALKIYSWKILNTSARDKSVTATKDGNTFTVRISPSKAAGFRTLVVLSFKYGKSQ